MELGLEAAGIGDAWDSANRDILWGWKRDAGDRQRVILFGARLETNSSRGVRLDDWFFYYRSRSQKQDIDTALKFLRSDSVTLELGSAKTWTCPRSGLDVVEISAGPGMHLHRHLIRRLLQRRPRRRIPIGEFPSPSIARLSLGADEPIAAYVGSGLSYESGLPTLASVHEVFGVDRLGDEEFTFGAKDPLLPQLAASVRDTFRRFAQFHLLAAAASPSSSHQRIAALHRRRAITRILTDNVDSLFARLNAPFTRTRGIGIFNDQHLVHFNAGEKTLLVVGVAADRRSIIRQARLQGLSVVVVNPQEPVSPRSQNLSYLRREDTWYRMSAREFFAGYVDE